MVRRLKIRENYAFLLAGLLFLFLLIPILKLFPLLGEKSYLMRASIQTGFSCMMVICVWGLHRE